MNQTLAELKVRQHRDKTFIGRVSRGFDFLGYLFTPSGLEVAPLAVERCVERVSWLYEKGEDLIRIGAYVRRWQCWARSGLRALRDSLAWRALDLFCRTFFVIAGGPLTAPADSFVCDSLGRRGRRSS